MSKIRRLLGNILYFLSSTIIQFTLGFAASIILARTLKPENLGIFHQIQWLTSLVSAFLAMGYITAIIKFTAEFRSRGEDSNVVPLVRMVFLTETAITLLATGLLMFFRTHIADFYFSPEQSTLFAIGFLGLCPGMQTAVFSALLEGCQIFKYQTVHALSVTPLSLATKIYLMLNGYGVEALLWANLGFSVANLVFFTLAVNREGLVKGWFQPSRSLGPEKRKTVSRYNRSVFSIHLVDQVVWNRSENFFLGRFCAASQVAYYNLAQNLAVRLTGLIPSMMWRILLPLSAENEGGKNPLENRLRTYRQAVRYSAFLVFPLVTICTVCAYEIIVVLYGQEYADVKGCFQILCLGVLVTSLAQPGSALLYAANRQRFIFWYGSCLGILNLGLNFWIIPVHGAVGAAACYSTVTVLGVFGGFIYLYRHMKITLPWVSLVKIILACLCLALILFLVIRQDTSKFDVFSGLLEYLNASSGLNWDIVFGPRTVRLLFSVFTGCLFYAILALTLFSPGEDDRKIFAALGEYLPKPIHRILTKWTSV